MYPAVLALALSTFGGSLPVTPSASAPAAPVATSGSDSLAPTRGDRRVPRAALPTDASAADSVVVRKAMRTLTIYRDGKPLAVYVVALGQSPLGAKRVAGDNRTPEGVYRIDWRNPNSKFHLALHIDYPRAEDVARAQALGQEPGGDIMIHGLPERFRSYGPTHLRTDWTNGCIALTNAEMEALWQRIPDGTPIEIKA